MATSTYNLIASQVVGSGGAASVTFSSIPNTYTDLLIKISARSNYNNNPEIAVLSFNGSSSSFTNKNIFGTGSSAVSQSNNDSGVFSEGNNWTANTFGSSEFYIPNYTSSNYKSINAEGVSENNGTGGYQELNAVLWSNTAAITSIGISTQNGTGWLQYSTFYLYGIKNS